MWKVKWTPVVSYLPWIACTVKERWAWESWVFLFRKSDTLALSVVHRHCRWIGAADKLPKTQTSSLRLTSKIGPVRRGMNPGSRAWLTRTRKDTYGITWTMVARASRSRNHDMIRYPKDILTSAEISQVQIFVLKSWKIMQIQDIQSQKLSIWDIPKPNIASDVWDKYGIFLRYLFLKSYPMDIPGIYTDIPKLQKLSRGLVSRWAWENWNEVVYYVTYSACIVPLIVNSAIRKSFQELLWKCKSI